MTIKEIKASLSSNPQKAVFFQLPEGHAIPPHFHITEVAFSKKDFIDCGGTIRHEGKCLLQIWVADDTEHRVDTTTFAKILKHAKPIIPTEALPVEIEYNDPGFTLFPIKQVRVEEEKLTFLLAHRQTDCLAKDVCGIQSNPESCEPNSGCC